MFGDLVGLKLPDIRLTGEEKTPKKTSPRKLVPTGNRTRARCVTSAHFYRLDHSGGRDICHTVGPTFVFCVVEVCRLRLEPL